MAAKNEPRSAARSGRHERTPFRVGQILDWGIGVPPLQDQLDATALAFEEATEAGVLDRPVEVVTKLVEGLPYGSFGDVRRAYLELVEMDCIGVIGPHITEQTIALNELVHQVGVPTLVMSGTLRFHGDFHFLLPNGTFCDEAAMMVQWLADQGAATVGVLREDNSLGDEYFDFFRLAARERRLGIVSQQVLGTFIDDDSARQAVARCREDKAASLAYMGFGVTARAVFQAVKEAVAGGWDRPRVLSSIYLGTIPDLGYGLEPSFFEGWAGIDQFDERNPVLTDLYARFEKRYGRRPPMHCYLPIGYDLGNAMAKALSMAKPATPLALRDAFERVRMLPAAIGGAGTMISFGPYDHRGYKGPYIVLRKVVNGENVLA